MELRPIQPGVRVEGAGLGACTELCIFWEGHGQWVFQGIQRHVHGVESLLLEQET